MASSRLARAACLLLVLAASGDRDLADLEQELRAPKPETRRAAVQKLAAMHVRRAWDLVVGALSDSDSMVADEAEVLLGHSASYWVSRSLLWSVVLVAVFAPLAVARYRKG